MTPQDTAPQANGAQRIDLTPVYLELAGEAAQQRVQEVAELRVRIALCEQALREETVGRRRAEAELTGAKVTLEQVTKERDRLFAAAVKAAPKAKAAKPK